MKSIVQHCTVQHPSVAVDSGKSIGCANAAHDIPDDIPSGLRHPTGEPLDLKRATQNWATAPDPQGYDPPDPATIALLGRRIDQPEPILVELPDGRTIDADTGEIVGRNERPKKRCNVPVRFSDNSIRRVRCKNYGCPYCGPIERTKKHDSFAELLGDTPNAWVRTLDRDGDSTAIPGHTRRILSDNGGGLGKIATPTTLVLIADVPIPNAERVSRTQALRIAAQAMTETVRVDFSGTWRRAVSYRSQDPLYESARDESEPVALGVIVVPRTAEQTIEVAASFGLRFEDRSTPGTQRLELVNEPEIDQIEARFRRIGFMSYEELAQRRADRHLDRLSAKNREKRRGDRPFWPQHQFTLDDAPNAA